MIVEIVLERRICQHTTLIICSAEGISSNQKLMMLPLTVHGDPMDQTLQLEPQECRGEKRETPSYGNHDMRV